MQKRIGFIGIIVENRTSDSEAINKLLSQYGEMIVARLGIPRHGKNNISVITLVVEATTDEVGLLTGKLGALPGVSVKSGLSKIEE